MRCIIASFGPKPDSAGGGTGVRGATLSREHELNSRSASASTENGALRFHCPPNSIGMTCPPLAFVRGGARNFLGPAPKRVTQRRGVTRRQQCLFHIAQMSILYRPDSEVNGRLYNGLTPQQPLRRQVGVA